MTRKYRDLSGMVFGNLSVFEKARSDKRGYALWRCQCSCGEEVEVTSRWLTKGIKKSCNIGGHRWSGSDQPKRGTIRSRFPSEYTTWKHMRYRCSRPSDASHGRYGGRGIAVCERWALFANFLADMGPKPTPQHSIDRIDNDGNYEPGNCRWATPKEQARNTRRTVMVLDGGRTVPLADFMERMGLDRGIVYGRLKSGWTIEEAIGAVERARSGPGRKPGSPKEKIPS